MHCPMQYASCRIPIPLMKPVEEELNRMEAEGIIEKVTEPTECQHLKSLV